MPGRLGGSGRSRVGDLATAVESKVDQAIAVALDGFLRMPAALRRSKRGGRKGRSELYFRVKRFLESEEVLESGPFLAPAKEAREDSLDRRRILKAEELVGLGYRRKAARLLRSNEEIRRSSSELTERLGQKFPQGQQMTEMEPVRRQSPRFVMELEDFVPCLKKTFNGSGGGQSGLTDQHIKAVIDFPGVGEAFLRLFSLLIDGEFPVWAHPYLCTQRLLALGEKERPVCVGEWAMRTASKLCNQTVSRKEDEDFFLYATDKVRVLQFGNQVSGSQEAAVFRITTLIGERGAGRVVVSKDGTNAYNRTERNSAVNFTAETFPTTERWVKWLYGTASFLRTTEDEFVWGCNGVFQGDALGGRVHDTALQRSLVEAAEATVKELGNQLDVVAFRDDVYVIATPTTAVAANSLIDEVRLAQTGVAESKQKTSAFCPRESFISDEAHVEALEMVSRTYIQADRISEDGIKVLGAPIGHEGFIDSFSEDQMQKYPLFLPRLRKMDAQMALVLLRECYLPVATHLIRMVEPVHTVPHAQMLDVEVHATYKAITGDASLALDDPEFFQPFKFGGKGFRSVAVTAPIAHYASSVQSMATLLRIVPKVSEPPDPGSASHFALDGVGRVAESWRTLQSSPSLEGLSVDDSLLPSSEGELLEALREGDLLAVKLQNAITQQVEKVTAEVAGSKLNQFERARTMSTSTSGSSSVFTCIPADQCLVMPPSVLRFAAQYTAGTHQMANPMGRSCVCDEKLSTVHVLSCKKMRGVFVRHDLLRDVLKKICSQAGVVASIEVMVVEGRQQRMDLVLYFSNPVRRWWVDVSVVNPQAASYVGKDAVAYRENAKRSRWSKAASEAGVEFWPFVVDTFGKFGEGAKSVVDAIAESALQSFPYPIGTAPAHWKGTFARGCVERLAVALAHANSFIVEEASLKAINPRATASQIYRGLSKLGR